MSRDYLPVLRAVVIACQAQTIALTWPLWQVRASPPLLPLVGFVPQFGCGVLLLATLVVVFRFPRAGIAAHFTALAFAIAQDETRLQPQVLSLPLLLVATLPGRGARFIGLAHLVALWLWSGLHKILSPEYLAHGGVLLTQRFDSCPESLARGLAILLAAIEIGIGVLACLKRTRPIARVVGAATHLAVVVWLSPFILDWNESVLPWNVALAYVAWVLLAPDVPRFSEQWRASPGWARALVVVELIAPAGYEADLVPAPFAHALYCMSTPHATWLHEDGAVTHLRDLPELSVFLPGTYHALAASFRAQAKPGDRLVIVEHRALMRAMGRTETLMMRE